MLLALCHRCWTWMEPKQERCVECGGAVNLREPDPDPSELKTLFGESLCVIGEVSLKRPKLPSFGVLSAFDHGLLFLPDLRQLPSGGFVAIEHADRPGSQPGFWSLFTRRTHAAGTGVVPVVRPKLASEEAVDRFLDSPGALFIPRGAIVRILQRGSLLRVERKPGRTVAWRLESPLAAVQQQFRAVKDQPTWAKVAMLLSG
jgi:hypothetical protein